jgi:hypothetical protein
MRTDRSGRGFDDREVEAGRLAQAIAAVRTRF